VDQDEQELVVGRRIRQRSLLIEKLVNPEVRAV